MSTVSTQSTVSTESSSQGIPLSVLDRALTRRGAADDVILREVVDRAVRLEALGFRGVWVAEHHAVPGIAGSSPALLASAVAGATSRIRVGTGGIMVPAHPPFVIAEAVSTLEALHPSRVDVGLGASTGFTSAVRRSLRQDDDAASHFEADVEELTDVLSGRGAVTLRPLPAAPTPLYLLTGGGRLPFAARAGLGAVLGGPSVDPGAAGGVAGDEESDARGPESHPGATAYRSAFVPSSWFSAPRLIVSASVAVAPTEEAARRLALPEAWAMALSRSTGSFDSLLPAEDLDVAALSSQQARRVEQALASTVHGTPEQVAARLQRIVRYTGADELLVTGDVSDRAGGELSDRLLGQMVIRRGDV